MDQVTHKADNASGFRVIPEVLQKDFIVIYHVALCLLTDRYSRR